MDYDSPDDQLTFYMPQLKPHYFHISRTHTGDVQHLVIVVVVSPLLNVYEDIQYPHEMEEVVSDGDFNEETEPDTNFLCLNNQYHLLTGHSVDYMSLLDWNWLFCWGKFQFKR